MVTVKASELSQGDRIPLSFVGYGEVSCPVVWARVRPDAFPFGGKRVDLSVRLGDDGPGIGTSVAINSTYTVIR
jgi:hypothetical protein